MTDTGVIDSSWYDLYAQKMKAHGIAYRAKKKGLLEPEPCEVCGTGDHIEMHHDDYYKPLEVRWICRLHHRQLHHPPKPKPLELSLRQRIKDKASLGRPMHLTPSENGMMENVSSWRLKNAVGRVVWNQEYGQFDGTVLTPLGIVSVRSGKRKPLGGIRTALTRLDFCYDGRMFTHWNNRIMTPQGLAIMAHKFARSVCGDP